MGAVTLPGFGRATECQVAKHHSPTPLRFVWHHILPKECGGQTAAANLVMLCDNDHYGVHVLLWQLARNGGRLTTLAGYAHTARGRVAFAGYSLAKAAGTVDLIPNEG